MPNVGWKIVEFFDDTIMAWQATCLQIKNLNAKKLKISPELLERKKEFAARLKIIASLTNCCELTERSTALKRLKFCLFCKKEIKQRVEKS